MVANELFGDPAIAGNDDTISAQPQNLCAIKRELARLAEDGDAMKRARAALPTFA
jgi:hypothetical protein